MKNIFESEIERNDAAFLFCFLSILVDIQNETSSLDKCTHRTVSLRHTVWEALLLTVFWWKNIFYRSPTTEMLIP